MLLGSRGSGNMAKRLACSVLVFVALFLAGCDHATKAIAKASLRSTVTVVPNVFDLQYTENHDTAFSLLRQAGTSLHPWILAGVALMTLIAASVVWWTRRRAPRLEQLGYSVIIGGALGNVIDRFARGYVVDFMHIHRWPVFNVADMAVVAGVGLVFLSSMRASRKEKVAT